MHLSTIDRNSIPPELQERLAIFEADRDAYTTLQKQLAEVTQEGQRLKQKASDLEGQADRTDASWKAMATCSTIDQAKINEEIERSAQLRKDAQVLRLTATARTGIQNDLVVRVADARMKLVGVTGSINKQYQQTLFAKKLKQEGTRDDLLDLFALSRALFLKSIDEHDGILSRCNSGKERELKIQELICFTFGKEIKKLFDAAEDDIKAPTLAALPSAVPSETVTLTHAAFMKLKRTAAAS